MVTARTLVIHDFPQPVAFGVSSLELQTFSSHGTWAGFSRNILIMASADTFNAMPTASLRAKVDCRIAVGIALNECDNGNRARIQLRQISLQKQSQDDVANKIRFETLVANRRHAQRIDLTELNGIEFGGDHDDGDIPL